MRIRTVYAVYLTCSSLQDRVTTDGNIPSSPAKATATATSSSKKRASPSDSKPEKRRKIAKNNETRTKLDDEKEVKPTEAAAKKRTPKARVETSGSDLSEPGETEPEPAPSSSKPKVSPTANNEKDNSGSEMSVLFDDSPKPKRKKRGSNKVDTKVSDKGKKGKPKSAKATELDPDAEEIKRLQGWLVQCGIRKMWARELKPYVTPKAKIRHLKELLSDAGMTGRFSKEKATQIREARELQADLEAVQEGAKHWGKDSGDEEQEAGTEVKPRRRLARGLENLDFLNDSDGEETD